MPPTTNRITRVLDVFEKVNREIPFDGLHWIFDHAETICDRNIERIRRWAAASPSSTAWPTRASTSSSATAPRPPSTRRRSGGCSTPACRSARAPMPRAWPATTPGSRCTGWSPGAPSAALPLYGDDNRLDRETALRLWTRGQRLVLQRTGTQGPSRGGPVRRLRACCRRTTSACRTRRIKDISQRADRRRRQASCMATASSATSRRRCRRRCPTGRRCASFGGYQGGTWRRPALHSRMRMAMHEGTAVCIEHRTRRRRTVPTRDPRGLLGRAGLLCFAF